MWKHFLAFKIGVMGVCQYNWYTRASTMEKQSAIVLTLLKMHMPTSFFWFSSALVDSFGARDKACGAFGK